MIVTVGVVINHVQRISGAPIPASCPGRQGGRNRAQSGQIQDDRLVWCAGLAAETRAVIRMQGDRLSHAVLGRCEQLGRRSQQPDSDWVADADTGSDPDLEWPDHVERHLGIDLAGSHKEQRRIHNQPILPIVYNLHRGSRETQRQRRSGRL